MAMSAMMEDVFRVVMKMGLAFVGMEHTEDYVKQLHSEMESV
eukprot:CAMPEP_0202460250 /NCGR_PEP_ID=MMETSP1360-20130828/42664_1 /ASSEMBLY_ACC=CAM_ASM_000848 /TAXON_ID=515479 /ORGANISM="Licmophora paradoxa, Strain CCMP2313" /LENGTH=41 /DNA_ID= /DNA_START= /DNA_END= /DNA_ORIENTATION=